MTVTPAAVTSLIKLVASDAPVSTAVPGERPTTGPATRSILAGDQRLNRHCRSRRAPGVIDTNTDPLSEKQYLLEHPERLDEDTQAEIAEDLGVSRALVTQVANDPGVKDVTPNELSTDEKREQVREYVENNPDASNREVTREVDCDVSHVTVGNWRDECDIQEPTTGLDTFTNSKAEADTTLDVVDTKLLGQLQDCDGMDHQTCPDNRHRAVNQTTTGRDCRDWRSVPEYA